MSEEYFDFEESIISQMDINCYVNQLDAEVLEMIVAEYESVEAYVKDYLNRNRATEGTYQLFECLASCKRREQIFLCHRFGLIDGVPKPLAEVAKLLGITRERAFQIERKCLRPRCIIRRRRIRELLED